MATYPDNMWQPSYFPKLRTQPRLRALAWWYQLTSPAVPMNDNGFRVQEIMRRGLLVSNIVLVEIVFMLVNIFLELQMKHYFVLSTQGVALLLCGVALYFNRNSHYLAASIIAVIASEVGIILTIIIGAHYAGNYFANGLETFYLLIQPEILAFPLLSSSAIFLVAFFNSLFAGFLFAIFSHSTTHQGFLVVDPGYLFIVQLVMLFFFIATIASLWKQSATQILMRADTAEVVAALEHVMAEQEHVTAQKKRTLDENIHHITQAHLRVANGDYSTRVPLDQDNVLWPIAGSLNTLLARIQRLGQLAVKLEETEKEAAHLAEALRAVRTGGPPVSFRRSGTAVDLIILELATTITDQSTDTTSHTYQRERGA